jgi:hypothetical protein
MSALTKARARFAVIFSLLFVFLGGFLVFDMGASAPAQAATSSTQGAIVCHPVTKPPTLPWWQCLQNIGGTSGSGNGPYGCYSHTVRVCD